MTIDNRYVLVNGYRTRYWKAGTSGPIVLLVHGFAASVDYWMYNIESLAKQCQVYALDLIGFGYSDKPNIKYDLATFSNFVREFVALMGLDNFVLVGHSLGGAISLEFVLDYPGLVQKLVLVDSAGFGQELPQGLRLMSLPIIGKLLFHATSRSVIKKLVGAHAYNRDAIGDDFVENMYNIYQSDGAKRAMLPMLHEHVNMFGVRSRSLVSITNRLSKLQLPILLLWGREDTMLPIAHADIAKRCLSNVRTHIFEKCGHMPQIEVREEFERVLLDFIKE